jgi:hypothetical protein
MEAIEISRVRSGGKTMQKQWVSVLAADQGDGERQRVVWRLNAPEPIALDEEVPLSAIFDSLKIQGIYRRITGKRDFRFFGSDVASSVRSARRVRREAIVRS